MRDAADTGDGIAALLRDLAWSIHRQGQRVAGIESIPNTELAVLRLIFEAPGITVGEISQQLGLRQSNTSAAAGGALRRLDEILRARSTADRRGPAAW